MSFSFFSTPSPNPTQAQLEADNHDLLPIGVDRYDASDEARTKHLQGINSYLMSEHDEDARRVTEETLGRVPDIKDTKSRNYWAGRAYAKANGFYGYPENYWRAQNMKLPYAEKKGDMYELIGAELAQKAHSHHLQRKKEQAEFEKQQKEFERSYNERYKEMGAAIRGVSGKPDTASWNYMTEFVPEEHRDEYIRSMNRARRAWNVHARFDGDVATLKDATGSDYDASARERASYLLMELGERDENGVFKVDKNALAMFAAAAMDAAKQQAESSSAFRILGKSFDDAILKPLAGVADLVAEGTGTTSPWFVENIANPLAFWENDAYLDRYLSGMQLNDSNKKDVEDIMSIINGATDAKVAPTPQMKWYKKGASYIGSSAGALSFLYTGPVGAALGIFGNANQNRIDAQAQGAENPWVDGAIDATVDHFVEKIAFGGVGKFSATNKIISYLGGKLGTKSLTGAAIARIEGNAILKGSSNVIFGVGEEAIGETVVGELANWGLREAFDSVGIDTMMYTYEGENGGTHHPIAGAYMAMRDIITDPVQLASTALFVGALTGVQTPILREQAHMYSQSLKHVMATGVKRSSAANIIKIKDHDQRMEALKAAIEADVVKDPEGAAKRLREQGQELANERETALLAASGVRDFILKQSGVIAEEKLPNGNYKVRTRDRSGEEIELEYTEAQLDSYTQMLINDEQLDYMREIQARVNGVALAEAKPQDMSGRILTMAELPTKTAAKLQETGKVNLAVLETLAEEALQHITQSMEAGMSYEDSMNQESSISGVTWGTLAEAAQGFRHRIDSGIQTGELREGVDYSTSVFRLDTLSPGQSVLLYAKGEVTERAMQEDIIEKSLVHLTEGAQAQSTLAEVDAMLTEIQDKLGIKLFADDKAHTRQDIIEAFSTLSQSHFLFNHQNYQMPQWAHDTMDFTMRALEETQRLVTLGDAFNQWAQTDEGKAWASQEGNSLASLLEKSGMSLAGQYQQSKMSSDILQSITEAHSATKAVSGGARSLEEVKSDLEAYEAEQRRLDEADSDDPDEHIITAEENITGEDINLALETNAPRIDPDTGDFDLPAGCELAHAPDERGRGLINGGYTLAPDGSIFGAARVADLHLSPDVPQFKKKLTAAGRARADEDGTTHELAGGFNHNSQPLQVWRRTDGRLEIISGRHRLAHAKKNGVGELMVRVYDESPSHDARWAKSHDIEQNILDGTCNAIDIAYYYTHNPITRAEAESRGLMPKTMTGEDTAAARIGITIALEGSPSVKEQLFNSAISAEDAYTAITISKSPDMQQLALSERAKVGKSGKKASWDYITALVRSVEQQQSMGAQLDLFGHDTQWQEQTAKLARYVARARQQITARRNLLNNSRRVQNNPAIAKELGVDIKTPEDAAHVLQSLILLDAAYERLDPELGISQKAEEWDGKSAPALDLNAIPYAYQAAMSASVGEGSSFSITPSQQELIEMKQASDAFRAVDASVPVLLDIPEVRSENNDDVKAFVLSAFAKIRDGGGIKIGEQGTLVQVSSKGYRKVVYHMKNRKNLEAFCTLPQLAKQAHLLYSATNSDNQKKSKQDIKQYHYYLSKSIDPQGNFYYVLLTVAERYNGEFFYDLDTESQISVTNIKSVNTSLKLARIPNAGPQTSEDALRGRLQHTYSAVKFYRENYEKSSFSITNEKTSDTHPPSFSLDSYRESDLADAARIYGSVDPSLAQVEQVWDQVVDRLSDDVSPQDYSTKWPAMPTPAVFRLLDVEPLMISVGKKVVRKTTNNTRNMPASVRRRIRNYHHLTTEQLKQLPSQLSNPITIYESETLGSLVVLTELLERGAPVIAAIHLRAESGGRGISIHQLASVYGKENPAFFQRAKMLYMNRARYDRVAQRLQSPTADSIIMSSEHTILNEHDLVNYKAKNSISFSLTPLSEVISVNRIGEMASEATAQQLIRDARAGLSLWQRAMTGEIPTREAARALGAAQSLVSAIHKRLEPQYRPQVARYMRLIETYAKAIEKGKISSIGALSPEEQARLQRDISEQLSPYSQEETEWMTLGRDIAAEQRLQQSHTQEKHLDYLSELPHESGFVPLDHPDHIRLGRSHHLARAKEQQQAAHQEASRQRDHALSQLKQDKQKQLDQLKAQRAEQKALTQTQKKGKPKEARDTLDEQYKAKSQAIREQEEKLKADYTQREQQLREQYALRTEESNTRYRQAVTDIKRTHEQLLTRIKSNKDSIRDTAHRHLSITVQSMLSDTIASLEKQLAAAELERLNALFDRLAPRKLKSGKLARGKMSAPAYRQLQRYLTIMQADETTVANRIEELSKLITAGLTPKEGEETNEGRNDDLDIQLKDWSTFGHIEGKDLAGIRAAHKALEYFALTEKSAWQSKQDRIKGRARLLAQDINAALGKSKKFINMRDKRLDDELHRMMGKLPEYCMSLAQIFYSMVEHEGTRELGLEMLLRLSHGHVNLRTREKDMFASLTSFLSSDRSMGGLGLDSENERAYWFEALKKEHATGIKLAGKLIKHELHLSYDEAQRWIDMSKEERATERERITRENREKDLPTTGLVYEADIPLIKQELLDIQNDLHYRKLDNPLARLRRNGKIHIAREWRDEASQEEVIASKDTILNILLTAEQDGYTGNADLHGYTPEVLAQLRDFVGADILAFGEHMRRILETSGLAEVYEEREGNPFTRIANYWPGMFDQSARMSDANALDAQFGVGARHTMLIQRNKHSLDFDISLGATNVFNAAFAQQNNYIVMGELTGDMRRILSQPDLAGNMQKIMGHSQFKTLKELLNLLDGVGVADAITQKGMARMVKEMQAAHAPAVLAGSIVTLAKQASAVLNARAFGGYSTREFTAQLLKDRVGMGGQMSRRDILALPVMQSRYSDSEIYHTLMRGGTDITWSRFSKLTRYGMEAIEAVDVYFNTLSAQALYNLKWKELEADNKHAAAKLSHERMHEICVDTITQALELGAQPLNRTQKSAIGALGQNNFGVARLLYMSSDSLNKIGMAATMHRVHGRGIRGKWAAFKYLSTLSMANQIILMALEAWRGKLPEEEDELLYYYLAHIGTGISGLGVLNGVPLIGAAISGVTGGWVKTDSLADQLFNVRGIIRSYGKTFDMMRDDTDYDLDDWSKQIFSMAKETTYIMPALGGANSMYQYISTTTSILQSVNTIGNMVRTLFEHYRAYWKESD